MTQEQREEDFDYYKPCYDEEVEELKAFFDHVNILKGGGFRNRTR